MTLAPEFEMWLQRNELTLEAFLEISPRGFKYCYFVTLFASKGRGLFPEPEKTN